jgi:hypothetical protein
MMEEKFVYHTGHVSPYGESSDYEFIVKLSKKDTELIESLKDKDETVAKVLEQWLDYGMVEAIYNWRSLK